MTRSRCNIYYFFVRAQALFGRNLLRFDASKRTPQFRHKTVFSNGYEPCLLCGIFGARSRTGTTVIPQGCNMALLWMSRKHVAHASAVLEGTLTECGSIHDSSCNSRIRSLGISTINFDPRPRHTHEGYRNRNIHRIARGPTFRSHVRLALPLRATPAPYRSSAGFRTP